MEATVMLCARQADLSFYPISALRNHLGGFLSGATSLSGFCEIKGDQICQAPHPNL